MENMRVEIIQSGECRVSARLINTSDSLRTAAVPVYSLVALHPHGTVLIDTGHAPRFNDVTRRFPACVYRWITRMSSYGHPTVSEWLLNNKIAPPEHAALTHAHADHIAGTRDFDNTTFWITEATRELAKQHKKTSFASLKQGFIPELLPEDIVGRAKTIPFAPLDWKYREHLPTGFDLFNDEQVVIVPLPGHAPGHCGVVLKTSNLGTLFYLSDAVWDIRAITERARSSRLASWLHETHAYHKTIHSIRALLLAFPEIKPLPCHCAHALKEIHSVCQA